MKKHEKHFLHETDDYAETVLWKVETLDDDSIDVVFKLAEGRDSFELWEFVTSEGDYDDTLQKITSIQVALEELKDTLVESRNVVQFRQ